jgi:hypothetical protein
VLLRADFAHTLGWVARLKVLLRTLKALARDPRIPRPIRWLLVFGLLPIPGPFDEAVLLSSS